MITMTLIPAERSSARAVKGAAAADIAQTTWNGVPYYTRSANGASMALARLLVATGCPEQPWQAVNADGQRTVYGDSLHALSRTTIRHSRFVRYRLFQGYVVE